MNPNSGEWIGLKRDMLKRIEKLRDELERSGIDPEPLRGEIAGLRWVIKHVEPDKPITEPTGTDYLRDFGAPDPS